MPTLKDRLKEVLAPRPGESLNLFQASATIFPICAIYLYFSGYVFCYFYYYRYFGVTLESLDLSTQFYLMRAYTSLGSVNGVGLLVAVFLAITAYLRGRLRTGITLLVMVAAFPGLYLVSYWRAGAEYKSTFCNPRSTIRFHFKEQKERSDAAAVAKEPAKTGSSDSKAKDSPASPADAKATGAARSDPATGRGLMEREEKGELSLLLETKDRIVVFLKPDCDAFGPKDLPQAHVYTLLRADLDFTSVIP